MTPTSLFVQQATSAVTSGEGRNYNIDSSNTAKLFARPPRESAQPGRLAGARRPFPRASLLLRPWALRFSGETAALSSLAAAIYWLEAGIRGGTSLPSPQRAVFGYAVALLISGFVAGPGCGGNSQAR